MLLVVIAGLSITLVVRERKAARREAELERKAEEFRLEIIDTVKFYQATERRRGRMMQYGQAAVDSSTQKPKP